MFSKVEVDGMRARISEMQILNTTNVDQISQLKVDLFLFKDFKLDNISVGKQVRNALCIIIFFVQRTL